MEKIRNCTVFLVVILAMTGAYSVNLKEKRVSPLLYREKRDGADILPGQDSETIENLRQELDNKVKFIDEQKSQINKNIELTKKMLIEKTNGEKNSARQKFLENKLRLVGIRDYPALKKGAAFHELDKQQKKIRIEIEENERQMEELRKKRPSNSETRRKWSQQSLWSLNRTEVTFSIPKSVPGVYTPQEYYITHEILQNKLSTLKEEEADLLLQKKKLESEKNYLFLEQKRLLQEDASIANYTLLNERYLLLTFLEEDNYAAVYKAFDLKELRYVACKVYNFADPNISAKEEYKNTTLESYNIYRALNASRVLKFYDAFEIDADKFCAVLEYFDGPDLEYYLAQHGSLPEKKAKLIVMQIVSVLKYLDDIKPKVLAAENLELKNILLVEERFSGEIKIKGFRMSIMDEQNINLDDFYSQIFGTHASWDVGCILYECLYGTKPNTMTSELEFPDTPMVSEEAKDFIRSCLLRNTVMNNIIDASMLAQHQYLQPPAPEHGVHAANTTGATSERLSLKRE